MNESEFLNAPPEADVRCASPFWTQRGHTPSKFTIVDLAARASFPK